MHSVYRHANNQKIDQYIQKNRSRENAYFYKKGSESAKNMIKALKNNVHVQRRQAIKQKSLVIKELNENTKLLRTITSSLGNAGARKSRGRKTKRR